MKQFIIKTGFLEISLKYHFKKNSMIQRFQKIVDDMHPLSIIAIVFLITIVLTGVVNHLIS